MLNLKISKYLKDVLTMYLGHNILELFNILEYFHSPQVKWCLISCITNVKFDFPLELKNDLGLKILRN